MTQHPCVAAGAAPDADDAFLRAPLASWPWFFFLDALVLTSLGFTETFTGVGCVLNTGIWQSSSVLVSGIK